MAIALAALLILSSTYVSRAQFFDSLEGMEAPEDVTGADCAMCHGDAAQQASHPHTPALEGSCDKCHQTTGVGGHGALISETRSLCLNCHADKSEHYPVLTCWTSSCHSDVHGSEIDEYLNPSRQEEYPGFFESTSDADFVGSAVCLSCHTANCEEWSKSMHSLTDLNLNQRDERGCESCHGPGGKHWGRWAGIGTFRMASPDEVNETCLVCHKSDTYVPDYDRTPHTKSGMSCIDCHNPHLQTNRHNLRSSPNSLCLACHESTRMDFAKFSHHPLDQSDPRSGMLCIDCHNPHGGEGHQMLTVDRDELCFSCHVDKQGPFIFSHAGYEPGMGRGCFTCHSAHGSNNPNMLKFSGRGLCMQCHTDRAAHFPAQTCWSTGCHTNHHGSNTNFFFFEN
jgi:DmsE family decaheme c-type cytochrome